MSIALDSSKGAPRPSPSNSWGLSKDVVSREGAGEENEVSSERTTIN